MCVQLFTPPAEKGEFGFPYLHFMLMDQGNPTDPDQQIHQVCSFGDEVEFTNLASSYMNKSHTTASAHTSACRLNCVVAMTSIR